MTNLSPRQLGAMTNTEYDEFCARAAPRDAPSDAPWWNRRYSSDVWSREDRVSPKAPMPPAPTSGIKPAIHVLNLSGPYFSPAVVQMP